MISNGYDDEHRQHGSGEPGLKVGGALRVGATVALVFAIVWFAVVLTWQAGDASPTALDLGLYLLLLPLVLLGGLWLLRAAIRRRREARAGKQPSVGTDVAGSPLERGPQPDRVLHLHASALWLRAGASAAAVAEALASPQRPPLHPWLRDSLGLPVFAAAVDDLDPAAVEGALRLAVDDPDTVGRLFGEERLRAIALLDPVAEELLLAALPPPLDPSPALAVPGLHPHALHHSRSSRAPAPVAASPVLRVHVLLPASWPSETRRASADWLSAKARAIGFDDGQFSIEVVAVAAADAAWQLIDRLAQARQDGEHDRHLLLATHSLIGSASIDRLDAARELLVSGHPEGLIPGEGAAGLLLGGADATAQSGSSPLRVHRMLHGPAGRGRGASRQAGELLQHAMTTAAQPAETIVAVFSDADHRPSRAIEIAGAIAATLPELEPVDDARHLGLACGDLGAVAPLAVLAAAAAHAAQADAPVLVFGLADPHARIALALSPVPPVDADGNAVSPNPAEAASAVAATA